MKKQYFLTLSFLFLIACQNDIVPTESTNKQSDKQASLAADFKPGNKENLASPSKIILKSLDSERYWNEFPYKDKWMVHNGIQELLSFWKTYHLDEIFGSEGVQSFIEKTNELDQKIQRVNREKEGLIIVPREKIIEGRKKFIDLLEQDQGYSSQQKEEYIALFDEVMLNNYDQASEKTKSFSEPKMSSVYSAEMPQIFPGAMVRSEPRWIDLLSYDSWTEETLLIIGHQGPDSYSQRNLGGIFAVWNTYGDPSFKSLRYTLLVYRKDCPNDLLASQILSYTSMDKTSSSGSGVHYPDMPPGGTWPPQGGWAYVQGQFDITVCTIWWADPNCNITGHIYQNFDLGEYMFGGRANSNFDGDEKYTINQTDVLEIINLLNGGRDEYENFAVDVNGDGQYQINDAIAALLIIQGNCW